MQNNKTIANAAAFVLVVTVVAKVIGFLESAIVAAYFGTTVEIDMFYLACNIANKFVFTIFSGLAVVGLTMYNNKLIEGGKESGSKFVTGLLWYMIPLAVIISIVIYVSAPFVSRIMTSNYSYNETVILTRYLRELSIITVFYVTTTIFTFVLNANKIFIPGVLVGSIQNICMIVFIISLSGKIGAISIVYGLIVGYILQTIFLFLFARKIVNFGKCSPKRDVDFRKIILLILPLLLGEATAEVNQLIDQYLATIEGAGYVSGLSYSETLNDVVTALFIQTVTTVLLSFFSALAVRKQYAEMLSELKMIFKYMTLILIPVSIISVMKADRIVSFVFERGNFDKTSVAITATALAGYALGFVFKTIMVIAKRPFFAIENTRTPMVIGIVAVCINIALSICLSRIWGIFGITVATSISYFCACIIYFVLLSKTFVEMHWDDCLSFIWKVLIASVITIIVLLSINTLLPEQNFLNLVIATISTFSVYILLLYFLRTREIYALKKLILFKINKTKQND